MGANSSGNSFPSTLLPAHTRVCARTDVCSCMQVNMPKKGLEPAVQALAGRSEQHSKLITNMQVEWPLKRQIPCSHHHGQPPTSVCTHISAMMTSGDLYT